MKKRYITLIILASLLLIGAVYFVMRVVYPAPETGESEITADQMVVVAENHYQLGNSWIRQNENGNWESYIEGNAYDRGRTMGILHKQLIQNQEQIFVDEINTNVPSWFLRKVLLLGIAWFNRDLDEYIPLEYRQEIYGVSEFFSDEYDFIGPKFNRIVNYHAAHDIGHAVQNMHLVGCTSVGIWNFSDSTQLMMSGRNFDFYFGDDFAKDKIVLLCNPDQGYQYLSVTWGGFCGVVSGMNEKGLSITLNSAKSEIPSQSGTPVSIIARDILQYASNIAEAKAIAEKYDSFVSELFTISSLEDEKMMVIEKSPERTGYYYPKDDTLVVANHYQSPEMKDLPINLDHLATSESEDRFLRTEQLCTRIDSTSPDNIAKILRNQKGIDGKDLGIGNPKAINQLLAHHAVIFDNVEKRVWVSNYPFQENVFDAYDLDDFDLWKGNALGVSIDSLQLAPDSFYQSTDFQTFEKFKSLKAELISATQEEKPLSEEQLAAFENSNPMYYETHRLLGNYHAALGNKEKAIAQYQKALQLDIAYMEDKVFIEEQIKSLQQ
ncbi:C45 family autoproteolytic acyltransferase/hydolase [Reichenbachiella ulvae]|uniref:C45 family autoproteolytic acyltransferase/hydrolase n=1 Tax=Reichenbachiella ulvae TaxID=2980104 RepID=A0ABT3CUC9_9BACT|nr:C45 family autoproteolytic acyltransferase/hydolase [Reichenbachiella ulvae]MCV9387202.1 C45 family autoproteolytic acyltransferase/hydrolase [Reichenbachiella ulvae]